MSTNNNRLGKEVKPIWNDDFSEAKTLKKLSSAKLQGLMKNELSGCTAITLANRGIESIVDLLGIGDKLRRLDLSENKLTRLRAFEKLSHVSMLNVSSNCLQGDSAMEELRYLGELRTLNISYNPDILSIRSHVVKPLTKLQAFIASGCGFTKISFLRFLLSLNSLVLSKNRISELPLKDLGDFSQLAKLSLGHNLFSTFPDLSACPNLEELRLNNNSIAQIPEAILAMRKLKTMDISHNKISDWEMVRILSKLVTLTNLTLKGNPLPSPPESCDQLQIREDISSELITDKNDWRYRRYVLSMFQHLVGKEQKPLVQLIVLDTKRVKVKWTQGGAGGAERLLDAGTSSAEMTVISQLKQASLKGKKRDRKEGNDDRDTRKVGAALVSQESKGVEISVPSKKMKTSTSNRPEMDHNRQAQALAVHDPADDSTEDEKDFSSLAAESGARTKRMTATAHHSAALSASASVSSSITDTNRLVKSQAETGVVAVTVMKPSRVSAQSKRSLGAAKDPNVAAIEQRLPGSQKTQPYREVDVEKSTNIVDQPTHSHHSIAKISSPTAFLGTIGSGGHSEW